ncbi:MAG TPA: radical SAM protein [Bacteroides sp.]|nr:radical SAM protein [Bacteroides sp.]
MSNYPEFDISDPWILSRRGGKNTVDPMKPYGWSLEKEYTNSGQAEDTATIFLSNYECPLRCLMCDLWKNTTSDPLKEGCIPSQIEWALDQLPPAKHLKLYNSGNFFDTRAVPRQDHRQIASLLRNFETVIIENHPKFINEKCLEFRDMLKPELQVAVGLETVHPEVLPRLNKKMKPDDFRNSIGFLKKNNIRSRAFILLRPPFLTEEEGIYWAKQSIDFAFDAGVECCTVIPTRAGNGAMDFLSENGFFSPPGIRALEEVLEYGIKLKAGRVFADVWDLELFSDSYEGPDKRKNRLVEMNLTQE